jgi:membrane fusion protein (multidrug efflux system)
MTNSYYRIFLLLSACALVSCPGNGRDRAITASGTIEATDVNVASKIGGQILALGISEGSAVKEGDVIALIDHSTLDLQLRQAKAGVQLAEANLAIAEKDFKRARELFSKGSATQKQRDDAEARFAIGQAQLSQARAAADLLAKTISDSTIVAPVSGIVTQNRLRSESWWPPGRLWQRSQGSTAFILWSM